MSQTTGESYSSDSSEVTFSPEITRYADEIFSLDKNNPTRALQYLDDIEVLSADIEGDELSVQARRLFNEIVAVEAQVIPITQPVSRKDKQRVIKRNPKRNSLKGSQYLR